MSSPLTLTQPFEGTRKELEHFLKTQPETQRFYLMPSPAYPQETLQEYRTLTAKKRRGELTPEEADALEIVKAQINAIDAMRPYPDTWEQQSERLRQEMADIREQIRLNSTPAESRNDFSP